MNVSLTPHLDSYVRDLVDGGLYASASEVVRAGLRLLEQHEAQLGELRALLREGLDGPAVTMSSDDLRAMIHEHATKLRGAQEDASRDPGAIAA